jgi:nitroimidazol reductase NimA-like FMN-containing flavoprotein (pyridoxamine 5'-phosphate oxidase superfamily)
MDAVLRARIVNTLAHGRDLTIATNRADGFPQATMVSYVSDGLNLYFGCAGNSQKARNLARDNRVSVTITCDYRNWDEIRGVSMAATAARITDAKEMAHVGQLMMAKFPQVAKYMTPEAGAVALYRITPKVISLLDYTKGFGHTEFVEVS